MNDSGTPYPSITRALCTGKGITIPELRTVSERMWQKKQCSRLLWGHFATVSWTQSLWEMDISWFVGTLLSNLVLLPDRGVDVTAADIVKPQIECRRRQVTLGAGERMLGIPYPTLIKGRGMLTGDIVQTPTPRFRGTYFWVHKYQIWATTYCIGQMGRVWQRLLDQCLNFAP